MDGIANVARQQQSQMGSHEMKTAQAERPQIEQPKQVNVVKQMQDNNSNTSQKINSKEQMQDLVEQLNKALAPMSTSLKFGVDMQDIFYVSVVDTESNKMIRRFPAEDAVDFLPKMQEVTGILFDSKG